MPDPSAAAGPRIGMLGGTFDPVHIGHLAVAVAARWSLSLDRLLLMVANDPWQKTGGRIVTPAEDRFAVVTAAAEGLPGIEASRMEIDRGGPTYTVDTLVQLHHLWPGARIFLVVGADVAANLSTWQRAADLPPLATLVVAERAGSPPVPDPAGWEVVHLPVPTLDVSSSDLRWRLATGRPVDVLIPAAAIRCIERRGLYAGGR